MLELQFKLEIETEMFKTSRKNRGTANNCGKYFAIKETHIASSDKMTIKFYTRLQCSVFAHTWKMLNASKDVHRTLMTKHYQVKFHLRLCLVARNIRHHSNFRLRCSNFGISYISKNRVVEINIVINSINFIRYCT